LYGFVWKPIVELIKSFLAGVDFKPLDLSFTLVSFLYCSVQNPDCGSPNIGSSAIAFDEGYCWVVGDYEMPIF
jgi:hypothetical protein